MAKMGPQHYFMLVPFFTRCSLIVAMTTFLPACSESRTVPVPEPRSTTAIPSAIPIPSADAAPPPIDASDASLDANAKRTDCNVRLQRANAKNTDEESIQFLDCNDHPQQVAYPECYHYLIERSGEANADSAGCLPSFVTVTLTGFQTMPNDFRAKLDYSVDKPTEATMRLAEATTTFPGVIGRSGALIGTLFFEPGGVKEFQFARGMKSQTGKTSLNVILDD
jgi:hypothetical protein